MKNILSIISLATLLLACGSQQNPEQIFIEDTPDNLVTLSDEQSKIAGIETGTLTSKNISATLKLNGKVDVPPQSMISISVPMGGYLKSTKLMNGMHVRRGEVLAEMEDAQYVQLQQDYLTAKAQFTLLESEYNRQTALNQSKATSDKVYEQANANYQTQWILIKSLEEKLKLIGINPQKLTADNISKSIHIYSPISGFVSAVNVNIGKYVMPSDVLFELVNPDIIHLSLTVFEKDVNKLSSGQIIYAYSNTNPEKKHPCKIKLISKHLENNNATEVLCVFDQYDKNLLPGMFMNADIELTSNNTTALPEEAVVRFENKQYIFIAKESNQYEMVEVQTGNTENGFIEIPDDQLTDQTIVIKGAYNLLMAIKNKHDE